MGVYVKVIYMENGINDSATIVNAKTNGFGWWDDPEATTMNFERLVKEDFYANKETKNFWDIAIEEGKDAVAVILPGKYIAINIETMSTACSNMSKNTRKKWKRRIIELIKRSKNNE